MTGCGCDAIEADKNSDTDCDKKQTLIPVDQALKLLLGSAACVNETEKVPLINAGGRVLAEDLSSSINVPPADNSAMDGYAIRSSDVTENNVRLPVSQRICAGFVGTELEAGTTARIFTGAPIPPGADAVVMQERVELESVGDGVALIKEPVATGTNVRKAGEDIRAGDIILKKGQRLKPQGLGLAASVGLSEVLVYRKLRVGVFFTGDELREPGESLDPGQIYNSNRYTLRGLLEALNCEIIDLGIIEDTLKATRDAMQTAAEKADLVMTSGGVSVGEEDYVRIALEELGQLDMWRINIKPGKPLAFGQIGDTPFLGMPGNPVSVFVTFAIFAREYILKKQGNRETRANSFMLPAAFEMSKKAKRCEYVRARVEPDGKGCSQAVLFPNQGSGVLTSANWANGLVVIEADRQINRGDLVEFIPFSELSIY